MKRYRVIFSEKAMAHIENLSELIEEKAGARIASNYLRQIQEHCKSLRFAPLRGRNRSDLFPGMRTIGFRRRVTISFTVSEDIVTIVGVYYGGRSIDADYQS